VISEMEDMYLAEVGASAEVRVLVRIELVIAKVEVEVEALA
jgi:hypothetical protein